jgi:hypothetical protein
MGNTKAASEVQYSHYDLMRLLSGESGDQNRAETLVGPLLPKHRELAFPRRIPGLRRETWGTQRIFHTVLNPSFGFFPGYLKPTTHLETITVS